MALQCEQIFPFPFDLDDDGVVERFGLACREREEVELTFESGEIEREDGSNGE